MLPGGNSIQLAHLFGGGGLLLGSGICRSAGRSRLHGGRKLDEGGKTALKVLHKLEISDFSSSDF